MNLLDEWKAPEPSPFWDVRMQARLREEQARASNGWLQWLRRPALSLAAALCLVAGIGLYQVGRLPAGADSRREIRRWRGRFTSLPRLERRWPTLQYLDKNSDLLQNFDALDDMDGDADTRRSN